MNINSVTNFLIFINLILKFQAKFQNNSLEIADVVIESSQVFLCGKSSHQRFPTRIDWKYYYIIILHKLSDLNWN